MHTRHFWFKIKSTQIFSNNNKVLMCENVIEKAWLRNLLAPWGCVALDNFPQTVFPLFFPTNKKQKRANRTYYVKRRQKVKNYISL